MASSGVLLMLSADYDGSISSIRSRLHACAPGTRRPGQLLLILSPACVTAWRDGASPLIAQKLPVMGSCKLPRGHTLAWRMRRSSMLPSMQHLGLRGKHLHC